MQRKQSGIDCLHTIRRMYFSTTYNMRSKYEMVFASHLPWQRLSYQTVVGTSKSPAGRLSRLPFIAFKMRT